ncbi:menD [Symbiodinium sp. CCMP2592]|nr:menD [Symbiodinium sp. CCMP2592]
MPAERLLLRQVLLSPGGATPQIPLGSLMRWLPTLPSKEASTAMDRSTVVLPRPGDGWYAPPAMSSSAGFPWGELTAKGVQQMRWLGQSLCKEAVPSTWQLRSAGLGRCVSAAQALAWGGLESQGDRYAKPVEVLVSGGEALLPQLRPGDEGYPEPAEESLEEMKSRRAVQATVAERLAAEMDIPTESLADLDADELCRAAVSVDGLVQGAMDLRSIKRLNYRSWAMPLRESGLPSAVPVIGPLISEMIRAFDTALEGSDLGLVVYVADASSLVCIENSMSSDASSRHISNIWPADSESLSLELRQSGSEVLFALRGRDGHAETVPYEALRARLVDALGTA